MLTISPARSVDLAGLPAPSMTTQVIGFAQAIQAVAEPPARYGRGGSFQGTRRPQDQDVRETMIGCGVGVGLTALGSSGGRLDRAGARLQPTGRTISPPSDCDRGVVRQFCALKGATFTPDCSIDRGPRPEMISRVAGANHEHDRRRSWRQVRG